MKAIKLPDTGRLMELFDLDYSKGLLLHKKKCGARVGSVAGNITPLGYRRVKVDGALYLSHRIIYAITGVTVLKAWRLITSMATNQIVDQKT